MAVGRQGLRVGVVPGFCRGKWIWRFDEGGMRSELDLGLGVLELKRLGMLDF